MRTTIDPVGAESLLGFWSSDQAKLPCHLETVLREGISRTSIVRLNVCWRCGKTRCSLSYAREAIMAVLSGARRLRLSSTLTSCESTVRGKRKWLWLSVHNCTSITNVTDS